MHRYRALVDTGPQSLVEGDGVVIGAPDPPNESVSARAGTTIRRGGHQGAAHSEPATGLSHEEIDDRSDATPKVGVVGGVVQQVANHSSIEFGDEQPEGRIGTEPVSKKVRLAEGGADGIANPKEHVAEP